MSCPSRGSCNFLPGRGEGQVFILQQAMSKGLQSNHVCMYVHLNTVWCVSQYMYCTGLLHLWSKTKSTLRIVCVSKKDCIIHIYLLLMRAFHQQNNQEQFSAPMQSNVKTINTHHICTEMHTHIHIIKEQHTSPV